jgi:hypothetical protein
MFCAFAFVYGCCMGLENQNWTWICSVVAEKLILTVTSAKLLHSVLPFSRQSPTPFESCFHFPDRFITHKLLKRQNVVLLVQCKSAMIIS